MKNEVCPRCQGRGTVMILMYPGVRWLPGWFCWGCPMCETKGTIEMLKDCEGRCGGQIPKSEKYCCDCLGELARAALADLKTRERKVSGCVVCPSLDEDDGDNCVLAGEVKTLGGYTFIEPRELPSSDAPPDWCPLRAGPILLTLGDQ